MGNFRVTSVLSNLMVGLTEKQVKILSVYKKAKKNAQKLFGWQATEKARIFAGLTKLQSCFKTESQTAFNRY